MRSDSDAVVALEAPFSAGRELAKGCAFFIAMVGSVSAFVGVIAVLSHQANGRSILLFSAAIWLIWIGMRAVRVARDRARGAQPSGQIRMTSSEITIPSILGPIQSIRWVDLKEVRLTRDIEGTIYYEFYAAEDAPSMVMIRSRVREPEVLDRELAAKGANVNRTFEWERPAAAPPVTERFDEIESGERFDVALPPTGWTTLRGCGGLLLALAVVVGLAFQFSSTAIRWMSGGAGTALVVAILLIGIFLVARPPKARIFCGMDGLRFRASRASFPAFIRWSDLRDYTYASTGGRYPSRTLTVWTPEGSWKLQSIRVKNENGLLSILRQRSARKPQARFEISPDA